MTKKKKKDVIEAIVELKLLRPIEVSYEGMIRFINAWGGRLVETSTLSPKAKVAFSVQKFKALTDQNPKVGKFPIWEGIGGFIESIKILEVKVRKI